MVWRYIWDGAGVGWHTAEFLQLECLDGKEALGWIIDHLAGAH